jgi:hypothetical protein
MGKCLDGCDVEQIYAHSVCFLDWILSSVLDDLTGRLCFALSPENRFTFPRECFFAPSLEFKLG